jgi:isoleucyl-tRNA synthetase
MSNQLREVKSNENFVDMEKRVMDMWEKNGVLKKYLKKNSKSKKKFSFIDGPITANNPMGIHHAWGRTYKDVVQRYKNMQGFEQRFQNGFDCQGLWVEVGVEKDLGFNSKKDILEYGMDNFTNACVARVNKFAAVQTKQSERLGMFMDWENSYYTMSETNNLYIWNFLKKCNSDDLLYKSESATTWCPRCETGLSQHEQADGYQIIKDVSVYVLFKLIGRENEYVLAWTTTPWTLSANVLLAVNPDLEYVKVKHEDKVIYMGKEATKKLGFKEVEDFDIKELIGLEYESLFDIPAQKGVAHSIVEWDLVDAESGSGVVHIAPGCGQEDYELGKELSAHVLSPLDSTGKFLEGYDFLTGEYAHDVASLVIDYLEKKGSLFKTEEYEHSYPHCWRCKTKCLFRLEDNWFINVQKIKKDLKKEANTVKWTPEFVGKRMQGWLDSMGDWMISRKRFYGLALPFYECKECGNLHVVGGKEELKDLAINPELVDKLPSVHRPWIDDIKIKCPKCNKEVSRISDVGDCWLDAGVVPFSTLKYLDDKKYWEKWFPADWIVEMIEQVRLWFYSMLVFGVVLEKKVPYKEVLGFAELRDENNDRMSKTKPNYVKFDNAADRVGSDIIRWNFVTASVGANMRFGWPTLEDVRRRFYIPMWNSYVYFVTYAKLHKWDIKGYSADNVTNLMDRWVINRVKRLAIDLQKSMDEYNMAKSSRDLEDFVKELSQWYIRRGRDRFRDGDANALGTLHYSLVTLSKLLAPMVPFVSEEMYQNLIVGMGISSGKESVHLEDYPTFKESEIDSSLLSDMSVVREVASNGLKVREDVRLNLRQPLTKAYVGIKDEELQQILGQELNVWEVEYSKEPIKGEGLHSFGENNLFITLDTNLTDELKKQGYINEFLRKYRDIRKKSGLKMDDRIDLLVSISDSKLKDALNHLFDERKDELQVKSVKVVDSIENPKGSCIIEDMKVEISF